MSGCMPMGLDGNLCMIRQGRHWSSKFPVHFPIHIITPVANHHERIQNALFSE